MLQSGCFLAEAIFTLIKRGRAALDLCFTLIERYPLRHRFLFGGDLGGGDGRLLRGYLVGEELQGSLTLGELDIALAHPRLGRRLRFLYVQFILGQCDLAAFHLRQALGQVHGEIVGMANHDLRHGLDRLDDEARCSFSPQRLQVDADLARIFGTADCSRGSAERLPG